ncbi:hypothetical protein [Nocardia cyriacigeorgica]|uniref:hypothetical protein n=1 Tax=Nocardia cyriacigeorgica TaxID=135487 RepID=UPI002457B3BB|nr:hypothetical protein [Nocardia cyriacigeorgica]
MSHPMGDSPAGEAWAHHGRPDERSILPLAEQMRAAGVDALITPAPAHLDSLTLHTLMGLGDVEMVWPRLSFARWAVVGVRG